MTSSRAGQEQELASVNATGQRAKLGLRLGGPGPGGCQGEGELQGLLGRVSEEMTDQRAQADGQGSHHICSVMYLI